MYITLTAMKFYFIIKSFFSIRFFKTLQLHQHRALAFVNGKDIVCGCYSIDTLNVIYSSHTLILLVCLLQKYVHLSPYTSLNHQECFKKIITTIIFSRNHQLRKLPPSFMLMRRRFVRSNFIGHDWWNGRELTNQLRQHISHIETLYFWFHQLLLHNFSQLSPGFNHFKHFSHLSCDRDGIFVFHVLPDVPGALRTMMIIRTFFTGK